MKGEIDAAAALDYAEFHLFPTENRYEACVHNGNKVETIASGLLEQLVLHKSELKDLFLRGSNADFKLYPPKNHDGYKWFTKLTLTRFLHIVGSPDILNTINTIENEINQLQEARKFHLSLYTKNHGDHSGVGRKGSCNLNSVAAKIKDQVETVSSDASKNELLRAMDLRLTALRGELAAAFNQVTGATFSLKDITDIEKFAQLFGAIDLRNTLRKFVELNQMGQTVDLPIDKKSPSASGPRNDRFNKIEGNSQISKPSESDMPVKYGVSPAKVAQIERHSSTESEESSYSSEEDRPVVERSRTLIRSASPRRSASPMRRIQIGRSGSHRATALTIKSLNFFPARERTLTYRDEAVNGTDEEGSELPSKKSETNVKRMSVQDAISLFESKQRDQTSDIQKRRSTLDLSCTNKSVLRRWSAGMGEKSTDPLPETVSESSVPLTSNNLDGGEIPNSSVEAKRGSDFVAGDHSPIEATKVDANLDPYEKRLSRPIGSQTETLVTQREENSEKLTASDEWSWQKEAELNQMLKKMKESKPVRYQKVAPDKNGSQDVPCEQRGGFYDHYKEKRDEKLRAEAAGKRAAKQAQFREMQQILEVTKAEMASANVNDVGRKNSLAKPRTSHKNLTPSTNPKKVSSKPALSKKAPSKALPSPAIRKSWPSTPSPRAIGISPAKTSCGPSSASTTPTLRKPQPASSAPRSSPKVERSQQQLKNVKASQNDSSKSMKGVIGKQQQPLTKNGKTAKAKVQTTTGKDHSMVRAKPSLYSKVTKKSSVVPLELKPYLRKGSGIGPGVGSPVVQRKVSSPPEETLRTSGDLIQDQENEVAADTHNPVSQQVMGVLEAPEAATDLELETRLTSPKCLDTGSSEEVAANGDDSSVRVTESALKTEIEEELVISPTAWVEIEEHEDLPIPLDESPRQVASAANVAPVAVSGPRVRHSLSQMLLEESAEPDFIEWGNAENPPAMVYQKDQPKGFKRLLKFARKSRADPNLAGWSSPSVFSEGEDDIEESKAVNKKNAKNNGHQKTSLGRVYEKNPASHELLSDDNAHAAQSGAGKFSAQSSSQKLQHHISAAASTSKATRSFFFLSAFRGSKPSETKFH